MKRGAVVIGPDGKILGGTAEGISSVIGKELPQIGERDEVDVVRVEALSIGRESVEVRPFFEALLAPFMPQAATRDVRLQLSVAPSVPKRFAFDPEKLGWIVAMLVGNALRFVRHGSRHRPGGSIDVALSFEPTTRSLEIVTKDDGPGIHAMRLPLLLRRTKGSLEFTGVALRVAHDIVVAHGGSMAVRSETEPSPHHGTCFTIRIRESATQVADDQQRQR